MQPDKPQKDLHQSVSEGKNVVQVAGNYIRGIPGWILLTLGLVLALSLIGSVWYVLRYLNRDSVIELVDVSVVDTREFPIIEFRLRNVGGKVAYIKAAEFAILDHRSVSLCELPNLQKVTWIYDVKINSSTKSQSKKVDQSIPANGTDRFQFRISSDDGGIANFYQLKINLVYNTGHDNRLSSTPLIINVPANVELLASYHHVDESYLNCKKENIENILHILNLEGSRNRELIESKSNLEKSLIAIEQALQRVKGKK